MTLFDEMLKSGETVFKNEDALDLDFIPKLLPYREQQQHQAANCIKPLLQDRNGRNLLISGAPGIGKTAAIKWVLRDLEETTDAVIPLYINCWQKNTTYKIMMAICEQLNYRFTQNKKTEELFDVIKGIINKKTAAFVFDEVDKAEETDFLYAVLNEISKKSIILITNYKEWLKKLEERVHSRLLPESLEFKPYTEQETKEILKQRTGYAFAPGAWDSQAFTIICAKAAESKDIRTGLFLLRESGLCAEENNSKRILTEHANTAIQKLNSFTKKNIEELSDDLKKTLTLITSNSGKKIGELFELHKQTQPDTNYKTFQRRIEKLNLAGYISTEKIVGGKEGTTTKIIPLTTKKITDF